MNLSQDEINAMLTGGSAPTLPDSETGAAEPGLESEGGLDIAEHESDASEAELDAPALLTDCAANRKNIQNSLTCEEIDALGEIGSMCMGAVAATMHMLLDRRVEIATPGVSVLTLNEVPARFPAPLLVVEVEYIEGISGKNLLLLKEADAALITDVFMGGEGAVNEPVDLSELHMSAINEIMNQVVGSSATALSKMIGRAVNMSVHLSQRMTLDEHNTLIFRDGDPVIAITFDMDIDGLLSSQLVQLVPYDQGRELSALMTVANEPEPEPEPAAPPASPPQVEMSYPALSAAAPFSPSPFAAPSAYSEEALHIIHDIPVQVSVELGRTKKEIREILDFDSGTVVVLDKSAGDPVEIFVNGKLVASGDVVVIDENYGVRITALHA